MVTNFLTSVYRGRVVDEKCPARYGDVRIKRSNSTCETSTSDAAEHDRMVICGWVDGCDRMVGTVGAERYSSCTNRWRTCTPRTTSDVETIDLISPANKTIRFLYDKSAPSMPCTTSQRYYLRAFCIQTQC